MTQAPARENPPILIGPIAWTPTALEIARYAAALAPACAQAQDGAAPFVFPIRILAIPAFAVKLAQTLGEHVVPVHQSQSLAAHGAIESGRTYFAWVRAQKWLDPERIVLDWRIDESEIKAREIDRSESACVIEAQTVLRLFSRRQDGVLGAAS